MASNSNIQAYPFMFDPSQFADPYSSYNKMALPFMGQYSGTPTDAHGNPIQSYLDAQAAHNAWQPPAAAAGTTLNTSPQSNIPQYIYDPGGQYSGGGNNYDQMAGKNTPAQYIVNPAYAMSQQGNTSPQGHYVSMGTGGTVGSAMGSPGSNMGSPGASAAGTQQVWIPGTQAAPQAAAAAPTNPIDMNAAYLQALSNPGKVTTPGATVPQSAPPSNQSGVLQQFLQNWQQGGGNTQGAANYNNKGFFNALQGQV